MGPTELALEAAATITSSGAGTTGTIANLTPAQKRRIASDITATMQVIYKIAPAIYRRSLSADLPAPVTDTLTTTDGSNVVTTSYAFKEGSSVYVGGELNEIYTEGGVQKLRFPYAGASGSQAAVFYGDCVLLDSSVAEVIGPVALPRTGNTSGYSFRGIDGFRLKKFDNRAQAESWRRRVGCPERYWVEPFLLSEVLPADSLIVTGTMTPDASGTYIRVGDNPNGTRQYIRPTGNLFTISTNSDGTVWFLQSFSGPFYDWIGPTDESPAGAYTADTGTTGSPMVALASTTSLGQQSTLRLRVVPMPDKRVQIGYDVTLRAPTITVADLGTDDVPSTASLVVAENYHESLVRPIFLQMWAGSSWFRGIPEQRKRMAEDDAAAREFLKHYRPQQECNREIRPMAEGSHRNLSGRYGRRY